MNITISQKDAAKTHSSVHLILSTEFIEKKLTDQNEMLTDKFNLRSHTFKDAPPTRKPSMSSSLASSEQLPPFTDPGKKIDPPMSNSQEDFEF